MYDNFLGTQYGLIKEASENTTNYDVACARLLTENVLRSTKELIPVIDNSSDKYIKKIDDTFTVLSDISVDTEAITAFFEKIQHTTELEDMPLGTPLKNTNDIGRIKPEYLVQVVKDAASTINDIMNSRTSTRDLMTYFSDSLAVKIKKQIVISQRGIADVKAYIKSQERPNIVPMDAQAIQTLCIPFLRSFPIKKRELQEEISSVKSAINTTTSLMRSYTDTANGLKAKGQLSDSVIESLNYYLYNLNRIVDECVTFTTFCLLTKIESYTFNINSLMELYRKVNSYNPEGSAVYHESVYEDSMAGLDIDSVVNMAIYGNLSAVKDYARRTFDKAKGAYINASSNKVENIDFVLNHYTDGYPYGVIKDVFFTISHGLATIIAKMKDNFVSPESVIHSAGFEDSLTSRFGMMISDITSISKYTDALNEGKAKSAILFQILSEMKNSENELDKLSNLIKEVYDKIDETSKYLTMNPDNEIPNEIARQEMILEMERIERDYRNFLGEVLKAVIQRYKVLEDEAELLVDGMVERFDVEPENDGAPNFNVLAVEACMEMEDIYARYVMEAEMSKFRMSKIYKEYGVMLEAEQPATTPQPTTQATPQQTVKATPEGGKESPSPEVKDNSNNNPEAAKQNAEAAAQVKDESPEGKKKLQDMIKSLVDKITSYFDNVTKSFMKGVTGKVANSAKELITNYKEALLNRSYNSVELRIYNYFSVKSADILANIKAVTNVVGGINPENVATITEKELFSFLKFPSGMEPNDYMKLYYKVGPNAKKVEKVAFKNTDLKNKVSEMIEFCEDFYVNNGYTTLMTDIEALKTAAKNKLNSFKTSNASQEQMKAMTKICSLICVFTGAVLTGYRNRGTHYIFALRKLVPKNAVKAAEQAQADQNAESQVEGDTPAQPQA